MCFDDFGWEEMGMAGSLAEEMTEEERARFRGEQEIFDLDKENEEYERGDKL